VAAEDRELRFVTKVVAKKAFPLYTHNPRRRAFGDYEVVVLTAGSLDDPGRFFSRSGLRQPGLPQMMGTWHPRI
jgi:hypothetical protein